MDTIPLFPLSTVLLPHGRLSLRIFEPRYLDLVGRCLKEGEESGFGVVWLREGREVYHQESEADTRLAQVGTFASIVDWDSLPGQRLGILIEGTRKFRLVSSHQQADHLHLAEVEWIEPEPHIPLPEHSDELRELFAQLLQHPHIERLNLSPVVEDVSTLSYLLTQLLPIPEPVKFQLLTATDPMSRLQLLMDLLDDISGQ